MATTLDIKMVIAAVDKASKNIGNIKNKLKGAGRQADTFKAKMGRAMATAKAGVGRAFNAISMAAPLVIGGIAKVGSDYQQMMANLSTMTNKGFDEVIATYESKFFELSKTTGTSLKEITDGAFDALSRQVPENKLAQFLTVANEAAVAGATDMKTIIAAVKPLLNAYKMGVEGAGTVTDKMFKAFEKGNFKIGEFSDALAMVADDAANAGISIDDLFGTFAGLTQQFGKGSASLVQTTISAIISSFTKQGGVALEQINKGLEKSGKATIKMSSSILKKEGLAGAIQHLDKSLRDAGLSGDEYEKALVKILGRKEAFRFFLKMKNQMEAVGSATRAIANESKGLRKINFEKQMRARSLKKFNAQLKILMIRLSKALLPILIEITEALSPLLESFGEWAAENKETVKTIAKVALAIGGLNLAIGATKMAFLGLISTPIAALFVGIGIAIMSLSGKFKWLNDAIDSVIHKMLRAIGLKDKLTEEREREERFEKLSKAEQEFVMGTGGVSVGGVKIGGKQLRKMVAGGVREEEAAFKKTEMSEALVKRMAFQVARRRLLLAQKQQRTDPLRRQDVAALEERGVLKKGTTIQSLTISQVMNIKTEAAMTPEQIKKAAKNGINDAGRGVQKGIEQADKKSKRGAM
jgi:TP901 family phage tail tape measure protein